MPTLTVNGKSTRPSSGTPDTERLLAGIRRAATAFLKAVAARAEAQERRDLAEAWLNEIGHDWSHPEYGYWSGVSTGAFQAIRRHREEMERLADRATDLILAQAMPVQTILTEAWFAEIGGETS